MTKKITVQEEGVTVSEGVRVLNFIGAGVTAAGDGSVAEITIPGGGGGGNNLIPTDIVDPAAAPYVVQSGTLALLFFSDTTSTVTFANGSADGARIGVVGYYGGGAPEGVINIDRGSNISSSCWNPANKYLAYDPGNLKALTFVWSSINSFWVLASASVY